MDHRYRVATLLGIALTTFGCSDATAPNELRNVQAASSAVASRPRADQEATLQQVARAVAVALSDARVRLAVRDAMRDSPWNEHKLAFQEFVHTDAGRVMVDAAASGSGVGRAQFLARVAELPAMDFYFVHGEQRRSWRGTPGVVVGATLNSETGASYRFNGRGEAVARPAHAGAPGYPLVALIPAESKAVRQSPQAAGRGEVIQTADDGQRAESFRWIEPDGKVLTANMADIRAGRDPRFTLRLNTASANAGTRIDCIKSTIRDGGEFAGNVEIEVRAKFYGPTGGQLGTAVYGNSEFSEPNDNEQVERCPSAPLITRVMPDQGTARINVELWEDDCGCWGNDDDYYGARDFFWDDRAQYRDVGNDGNMIELDWNPIPPSVLSSVTVTPVNMYAGMTATAHAYGVDQYGYPIPSPGVSSWWVGNPYVAEVSAGGLVSGYSAGETLIHAMIGGITGTATATVGQHWNPGGGTCLLEPCGGGLMQ